MSGYLRRYYQLFDRSYYRQLHLPNCRFSVHPDRLQVSLEQPANFISARKSHAYNLLHLSPFRFAEKYKKHDPEYGFHKVRPFLTATARSGYNTRYVPQLHAEVLPRYYLDHGILPQSVLVKHLISLKFDHDLINNLIPQWLFDCRLRPQVSRQFLVNTDCVDCIWCPISEAEVMRTPENYSTYIYLVNKITKLQIIRSKLEELTRERDISADRIKMLSTAINATVQWMGSFSGYILHIEDTGHYTDTQLQQDKLSAPTYMNTIKPGYQWILHTGELIDTSHLIRMLPYGKKLDGGGGASNNATKSGSQETSTIYEMKGTCFEEDILTRTIFEILITSLLQPNKLRRGDLKIVKMLQSLIGQAARPLPQQGPSEIELITSSMQKLYDAVKESKQNICTVSRQLISSTTQAIDCLTKSSPANVFSLWKQVEKSQNRLTVCMLPGSAEIKQLLQQALLQALTEYLNAIKLRANATVSKDYIKLPEIVREFFGYNQKHIIQYLINLYDLLSSTSSCEEEQSRDHQIQKLITKLLTFNDAVLAQKLPKRSHFKTKMSNFRHWLALAGKTKRASHDLLNVLSMVKQEQDEPDEHQPATTAEALEKMTATPSSKKTKNDSAGVDKQPPCFIPQWSRHAQGKVKKGEAAVLNPAGGHNAHRLLRYIMLQLGISLLGDYHFCTARASFYPMLEIYRLMQFDYLSLNDFITWWSLPLPLDIRLLEKKKSNELSKLLAKHMPQVYEKTGHRGYSVADITSETIQKIYNDMTQREGSFTRRYLIITMLRENLTFFIKENAPLRAALQQQFDWHSIEENIINTMDTNRCNIFEILNDREKHNRECADTYYANKECRHCLRWRHVIEYHHKELVELYERWPILFAFDVASQAQKSRTANAEVLVYQTKLLSAIGPFTAISSFNAEKHKSLLKLSPRPPTKTFEQSIIDDFAEIAQVFNDPVKLFKKFTTESKRHNSAKNAVMKAKCEQAIELYEAAAWYYNTNYKSAVQALMMYVLDKFDVNEEVGLNWMSLLCDVSPQAISYVDIARHEYVSQRNRTLGEKALLRILAYHRKDFFIIRTFFETLIKRQKISVWPLAANFRQRIEDTIRNRLIKLLPDPAKRPSDYSHLSTFYMCYYHGTLQAAKVGTEYGKQGEKNTKSSGHDRITNDPSDGGKYCTTSCKAYVKLDKDDEKWNCLTTPNIPIEMSKIMVKLSDVTHTLCPYCANIMNFRWEKLAGGGPDVWCGQCVEGMRVRAQSLGYEWNETSSSVTPCLKPLTLGGIRIINRGCAICATPRSSSENSTYYLMWIDTNESGNSYLAYVPICTNHHERARIYHFETFQSLSLSWMTFILHSKLVSRSISSAPIQSTPSQPKPSGRGRGRGRGASSAGNAPPRGRGRGRGANGPNYRYFTPNKLFWSDHKKWYKIIPKFSNNSLSTDAVLQIQQPQTTDYEFSSISRRGKASRIAGFRSQRGRKS